MAAEIVLGVDDRAVPQDASMRPRRMAAEIMRDLSLTLPALPLQ